MGHWSEPLVKTPDPTFLPNLANNAGLEKNAECQWHCQTAAFLA